MIRVIESKDVLEIKSLMPAGLRILFLLLALFPLLAPYELIIRPGWNSYLNVFFLFAAVISIGALAVSAFLVWAAAAGLSTVLRFDREDGSLKYWAGAPIVRWRTEKYPIEAVEKLQVDKHDWSDGAPSYSLVTIMNDGRSFKTGSSWSKEEIEEINRRASSFLELKDGDVVD
jgi:hypothetical protein